MFIFEEIAMVTEFTTQTIQKALTTDKLVVIDFYAAWCGPCMMMKPIFHKVAESLSESCLFGQVNIDEWRDLAITYRVSSIPTIIALKDNKIVWVHTGTISEANLKERITELLKK